MNIIEFLMDNYIWILAIIIITIITVIGFLADKKNKDKVKSTNETTPNPTNQNVESNQQIMPNDTQFVTNQMAQNTNQPLQPIGINNQNPISKNPIGTNSINPGYNSQAPQVNMQPTPIGNINNQPPVENIVLSSQPEIKNPPLSEQKTVITPNQIESTPVVQPQIIKPQMPSLNPNINNNINNSIQPVPPVMVPSQPNIVSNNAQVQPQNYNIPTTTIPTTNINPTIPNLNQNSPIIPQPIVTTTIPQPTIPTTTYNQNPPMQPNTMMQNNQPSMPNQNQATPSTPVNFVFGQQNNNPNM